MEKEETSPRIENLSWGSLEVEGRDKSLKNAKLFPGGSSKWKWKETGTSHVPGIQPADVEELLLRGAKTVILSQGVYGQLQVCPETLQMLEERGIAAHVLKTKEAVRLYNELRQNERVGGLFHTTC